MKVRHVTSPLLVALAICAATSPAVARPLWADDSAALNGKMLSVVCLGQGPAIDLARDEAVSSCKASATKFLSAPTKVETKLIETEQEALYIGKAETTFQVDGLACDPEKEVVEKGRDTVTVWLRCRFDLSKAKVAEQNASNASGASATPAIVRSETRRLTVTTVPACTDIVVVGTRNRVFQCKANPTTVILEGGATRIIVRAKGYESKEIGVGGMGYDEALYVTFE